MHFITTLLAAALLLAPLMHAVEANNGEDITRPVARFDTRCKVQTGASSQNGNAFILTFRMDSVYTLQNAWQISLRVDAPFETFRCPKDQCNHCYNSSHMGDSLVQVFVIPPPFGKWTFGAGFKNIFPTGGRNLEIGDGKYQVFPSWAFKYNLGEWSPGAYVGAIFRHAFSYAGYAGAPYISQTYIQPFFNMDLPEKWFLNSSPEIFFDWGSRHWFVPFDIMLGKKITDKCVVSLEYESAIVYEYRNFRQELEFRIGFFF